MSRIPSTIFQKVRRAAFVHSFSEDSSFVEMATPETPCGKVPVLFTTWHLWVFSSVKSEIQQNTNDLLTVSGISSTIFQKVRMATFVCSLKILELSPTA